MNKSSRFLLDTATHGVQACNAMHYTSLPGRVLLFLYRLQLLRTVPA
ncbi:MAG: hypothetical protein QF660_04940 [Anaerolineales bacterium]|nr:hypothetical protein [Anaerolineales bacterium]